MLFAAQRVNIQPSSLSFYTSKEITMKRAITYMSNFANFRKVTKKLPQVHSSSKPSLLHSQMCDGDLRVSILELLGEVANKQQTLNTSTDIL